MLKLFDNTQIIQEARNSGRGGKLWKELLMMLLMIGIVFSLLSVVEMIPIFLLFEIDRNDIASSLQSTNVTVATLYLRIISAIVFVLICRFGQKRSWTSFGFKDNGTLVEYAKGLIIGFIMFGIVILVGCLCNAFYFVGLEKDINYLMIATIFGGFVIQGAQEEILCRGYAMTSIARKNSVLVAIIVNSIIFAIMHSGNDGLNVIAILNLFLFGIFMSVYMLKTDNISGVCAIHTIWNFVQGSFFGLSVSGTAEMPSIFRFKPIGPDILTGGAFGPEGSIITTAILVISIAIVVVPMIIKRKGEFNGSERNATADQPIEAHREENGCGDGKTG